MQLSLNCFVAVDLSNPCNAEIWQHSIDDVLKGLKDNELVAYLGDIPISRRSPRRCLRRLREAGLSVKPGKCRFHVQEIDLLGFRIPPEGISTENDFSPNNHGLADHGKNQGRPDLFAFLMSIPRLCSSHKERTKVPLGSQRESRLRALRV
jgi:hypothetical protein